MSVLAPPPSPTPSCTFDAVMSDSEPHHSHRIPMQSSKDQINSLKRKSSSEQPAKERKKPATSKVELSPQKLKEKEEKEAAKAERARAQQAKKAEREAREAEKTKAKEAKEAERQKAQSIKNKQASFLTSFIQKAQTKSPSQPKASSSVQTKSDFDKTFLPCQYKDLAPINRFKKPQRELDVGSTSLSREELLLDFKQSLKPRRRQQPRKKGVHPPVSVRDIKQAVTESDVLGGNAEEEARKALETLGDRSKIQVKLLQFASDRRPGWYGTWTKSTNLIGPRCPLGQDPVSLDYNYDSDADWEELGQVDGDDLQDADEKEESAGESDDDSEMDDWLVDDLEVEEEEEQAGVDADDEDIVEVDNLGRPVNHKQAPSQGSPVALRNSPFGNVPVSKPTNFLKPKKKVKLLGRRFDSKLVPFSAGPYWEPVLGKPEYDGFKGYQIEFLNDACFGLDPFSFVSVPIEDKDDAAVTIDPTADVTSPSKSKAPMAGGVLASLWSSTNANPVAGSPKPLTPSTPAKSSAFPDSEVPALLKAIEGSTKTRAGLVDDLKEKFAHLGKSVSKSALSERAVLYAAKEGKKAGAAWRIKDEYRALAGL